MANSNMVSFVNKLIEAGLESAEKNPISNPAVRYMRVAGESAAKAAEKKPGSVLPVKDQAAAVKTPDPLPARKPVEAKPPVDDSILRLDLTNQNLLNGFIMSEVLGRPKYLRAGRRSGGR